jgi:hypothetical protein
MRQAQAALRLRRHPVQRIGHIHPTRRGTTTNLHGEMQDESRIEGENDL